MKTRKQVTGWKRFRNVLLRLGVIFLLLGIIFLGISYGYQANLTDLTGFNKTKIPDPNVYEAPKHLWDWMELLIVPSAIAVIGIVVSEIQRHTEYEVTEDKDNGTLLQGYFDCIRDLIIEGSLLDLATVEFDPQAENPIQALARSKTATVLSALDDTRRMSVLSFLSRGHLIDAENPIIHLDEIELNEVVFTNLELICNNLSGLGLKNSRLKNIRISDSNLTLADFANTKFEKCRIMACLQGTHFEKAVFYRSNLNHSDFIEAHLEEANFIDSTLEGANFSGAHLQRTKFRNANLRNANFSHLPGETNHNPAIFEQTDFRGATLTNADFRFTDLAEKVSFKGANLDGACFLGAHVSTDQIMEAKSYNNVIMPDDYHIS